MHPLQWVSNGRTDWEKCYGAQALNWLSKTAHQATQTLMCDDNSDEEGKDGGKRRAPRVPLSPGPFGPDGFEGPYDGKLAFNPDASHPLALFHAGVKNRSGSLPGSPYEGGLAPSSKVDCSRYEPL
ncbi:unnamed protein product [Durusdinium trenchii]|uniref:Uncharacterized protein n=1 Tax=Durusdinium trenchii TaxID=1381693 RepID=A0ABP0HKE2_9DINO